MLHCKKNNNLYVDDFHDIFVCPQHGYKRDTKVDTKYSRGSQL